MSASSLNTYQTVYKRCTRKAIEKRQTSCDDGLQITAMDLVDDWIDDSEKYRPGTSLTHKSALLWAFNTIRMDGWQEAHARLTAIHKKYVPSTRTTRTTRITSHTSSDDEQEFLQRSRVSGRMLPEDDLKILLNRLATRGEWGARSQWFLLAGIASGARPVEWVEAKWIDPEKTILRIFNVKVKVRNAWHKVPPLTFTLEDLDDEVTELGAVLKVQ